MLTIRQVYQNDYPMGKQVFYNYTSEKYYEIHMETHNNGWSFSLMEEKFEIPFEKNLEEDIFDAHKIGSEVYVSEINGEECGIMVIQHMEWNNTLLIHDLYIDAQFKRKGIGSTLIEIAKKRARELEVRMITLETQTSNYPAIKFYLKNGFHLIGFNLAGIFQCKERGFKSRAFLFVLLSTGILFLLFLPNKDWMFSLLIVAFVMLHILAIIEGMQTNRRLNYSHHIIRFIFHCFIVNNKNINKWFKKKII